MTSKEPTVVRALRVVLAKIEAGWCQGVSKTTVSAGTIYKEAWCFTEAISETAREYPNEPNIHEQMMNAIRESQDQRRWHGVNNFIDWNDAPERTKEDVIGLLKDAIQYARKSQ